jgi:hypothetical protein
MINVGHRIFEKDGLIVGDYRKNQGQMLNPSQDLNFWVLPVPAARLLCRLIIFGKPLEVRLAQQLISDDAAVVHRTLIGANNGKPLKSTRLGAMTNSLLFANDCPGVHDMRHVREHFSTELMINHAEIINQNQTTNLVRSHFFEIAAVSSNHSVKTSRDVYAGVFERHSVGGLREIELREKLAFSTLFNSIVLGFGCEHDRSVDHNGAFQESSKFLSQDTPSRTTQSQMVRLHLDASPFFHSLMCYGPRVHQLRVACPCPSITSFSNKLLPQFDTLSRYVRFAQQILNDIIVADVLCT